MNEVKSFISNERRVNDSIERFTLHSVFVGISVAPFCFP